MGWRLKPRRGTLFDNWLIRTPDGEPLCRASLRKVRFYLRNDLGEVTGEKELTLNFAPNGPGDAGDQYMLEPRQNLCVVCGTTERLTKHHVVPYCYRRWFPDQLASRNSYDIVPLCTECHERYEPLAHQRRIELAQQHGLPHPGMTTEAYSDDDRLRGRAIRAASALARHAQAIPREKRAVLFERVDAYLGRSATWTEVHELAQQTITASVRYTAHWQLLVECVKDDLDGFARGWREHFVATMQPRFLSPLFRVDHPVKRKSERADSNC